MATANLPDIEEVREAFDLLEDWEDRFQYVIDLGKRLPPMPEDEVIEANRVHGCQASVWLVMDTAPPEAPQNGPMRVNLRAVSDAHIVNGLIAILLSLYNGKTPPEVLAIDAESFFGELGLEEHLSRTRRNGLHAMLRRIRELAQRLATDEHR